MTKFSEIDDNQFYHRGRDYPIYKGTVKMSKVMTGADIKDWFSEKDLKDYPKPEGYTGSLP